MAERICDVPGCSRKHYGQGYCHTHWARVRRRGSPLEDRPVEAQPPAKCRRRGCNELATTKRYCPGHYADRTAFVEASSKEDIFWRRVAKAGDDECWLWQGYRDSHGYGRFTIQRGRGHSHMPAPRAAFFYAYGFLPKVVRHTCDNPTCVNPNHLLPGTQKENGADAARRGRTTRGVRNPAAKLTPEAVRDIRARRAAGERGKSIAADYGVHEGQVWSIMAGTTWSHVR